MVNTLDRWIFIKRWQSYDKQGNRIELMTALLLLLLFSRINSNFSQIQVISVGAKKNICHFEFL